MRLKRREAQPIADTVSATGHIDRYTNGIITGWFFCTACESDHSHGIIFSIDGSPITCQIHNHDRADVPGGSGFALRFDPSLTPPEATNFTIACALHGEASLTHEIEPTVWQAALIAVIERCDQKEISGWLAESSPTYRPLTLRMSEVDATLTVWRENKRPDVSAALGGAPAWGFRLDLRVRLGWVVPPDTEAQLIKGDCTLITARVEDEELQTPAIRCNTPTIDGRKIPAHDWDIYRRLEREPSVGEVDARWLLGADAADPGIDQWHRWLKHLGFDEAIGLLWKALVLQQRTGMQALAAIPNSLKARVSDNPSAEGMGDGSGSWFTRLLGHVQSQASQNNYTIREDMFYLLRDLDTQAASSRPLSGTPWGGRKVCVAGMVGHGSGLGGSAADSVAALQSAGFDVCTAPFVPFRGQWRRDLMLDSPEALDLTDHVVLLHVPLDRVVDTLRTQPALLRARRLIGILIWETEGLPRELARALDVVDEIWAASQYVADVFRESSNTRVHVAGLDQALPDLVEVQRADFGINDDQFVVHFAFDANSTISRKNPAGCIQVFQQAFSGQDDCALLLKVRNLGTVHRDASNGSAEAQAFLTAVALDPRIRMVSEELSYGNTLGLLRIADCHLALHRSEGFGYGLVEAQALGVPIITLAYSGPKDFLEATSASLLPPQPRQVLPGEYFFWSASMRWAEFQETAAVQELRRLYDKAKEEGARSPRPLAPGPAAHLADTYQRLLRLDA